jgi:hypothetical protein
MLVELAIKYYGMQCTCITSNYQFQYWPSLLHNVIYESNYRSDYDIIQQGSDQMIQRCKNNPEIMTRFKTTRLIRQNPLLWNTRTIKTIESNPLPPPRL